MAFIRETAHRLFAEEFNASRAEIQGEGEKDPNFLVSPLGSKTNRLHIVGVCTDVEPVGETGEVWRARISDPTGIFTVYAGSYQPEAAQVMSELQPPAFVAVTGKARTYEPEPGSVFVSVRPESVTVVDEATRNRWILDAAACTIDRIDAMGKLRDNPQADRAALAGAGVPERLLDGVMLAKEHYSVLDVSGHKLAVETALAGILPGGEVTVHAAPDAETSSSPEAPAWTPKPAQESNEEEDAFDDNIRQIVAKLEGDKGADWDDIVGAANTEVQGADEEAVEASLNRLMDKGIVYEPTLGVLRTT